MIDKKSPAYKHAYYDWDCMKQRCYNPRNPSYKYYGGKGITMSKQWIKSFKNFLNDMGVQPSKGARLIRIDKTKGYMVQNCKWVAAKEFYEQEAGSNNIFKYRRLKDGMKSLGKIGFTGTQSTGKTEKCKELFTRYHIPMIREVARCCPFPINKEATRDSQLWIFTTMVKRELEYNKNFPGGFCCDRTLADVMAYTESDGMDELSRDLWAFTQNWMGTYSKVFFCRPAQGVPLLIDHVRDADPLWREEIDRRIEAILKSMGVKYIEVESIEDVIEEINHELQ